MAFKPGTLICPACRKPPEAWDVDETTMRCSNLDCERNHTRLDDGTQVVVGDGLEDVQACDVLRPIDGDVLDLVDQLVVGGDPWRWVVWASMYVQSHYGDLAQPFTPLCDALLGHIDTPILHAVDLGCGAGRMAAEVAARTGATVQALDANPLMLRWARVAARGVEFEVPTLATTARFQMSAVRGLDPSPGAVRWICADVFNPPLPAERADLVSAVSLVDSVMDPHFVLGQACALVRPGGHLLLAQPDTWDPASTPAEAWLAHDDEGWNRALRGFGLETVAHVDDLEWELWRTPRQGFHYRLHGRLARKTP